MVAIIFISTLGSFTGLSDLTDVGDSEDSTENEDKDDSPNVALHRVYKKRCAEHQ